MSARILWTARSSNSKTGDVPTGWVGESRGASMATCKAVGCPLLKANGAGSVGPDGKRTSMCYAQHGSPSFAHAAMVKALANGADRSLETALANRSVSARMVRVGAIGDPGAKGVVLQTLVASRKVVLAGLAYVGYTHGWRERAAAGLRGVLMASCDHETSATGSVTYAGVDEALAKGWRAVTTAPAWALEAKQVTPNGVKLVACPAIVAASRGKTVTCNDCRLCDGSKPGPVIMFPDHGATSQGAR